MVAINTQMWALQLLQVCAMNSCDPQAVVLNCNHHHVKADQDATVVIEEAVPWHVKPNQPLSSPLMWFGITAFSVTDIALFRIAG